MRAEIVGLNRRGAEIRAPYPVEASRRISGGNFAASLWDSAIFHRGAALQGA
jgi:hypothetical protein